MINKILFVSEIQNKIFSFSFLQFKSPESYKSGARHYKISNMLSKSMLAAVAVATLTVSAAFATVPAQTSACNYQFATNLRLGAVSSDVQNLQKLLNMDAATRVAVSGAGSMGAETFRFGPATFAAVKKFQAANGITPMSGYVGPLTRATLNTICSSTVSTTPTNTNTGSGVVSNNIPVSVLVNSQANAKLAEFVVSGNGTVTGIELMRTGLSNNSALSNVYLYDGATRLTSGSSVLSDGSIRFNSASGLFPVSGSKTITVRADVGGAANGQTVGVAMKSVTMMGGTATPVTGANGPLFSVSSAQMGTAKFTLTNSPASTTLNAGSMNQTIWSNNLNVGTNAQKLHGMTFKMIGSAPSNTLANVKLFVDGVERGMASMNSNNQYVFNMASSPVMMNTGSHLVEVRGDIVAGASRNFYLSVEEATDVMVEDTTLPGIMITATDNASTPNRIANLNSGTVTVGSGTLTINQDTSFSNTTTLVSGATNVKMAAWKITSYGEDVKITSLTATSTLTGSTTLQNIGLYVNGGQVGSNQSTVTNGLPFSFNSLGTNLLVPAGQTVVVEIRGDVTSSNVAVNSGNVKFDLVQGSSNAQGMTSNNLLSTASQGGQQLSIASSNVVFALSAGAANSTTTPSSTGRKIGSFTMQTGSSEGATVNQVTVTLSSHMSNQITNLTVKDGSTVIGTPIGSPVAGSNNFSANLSVPMNTTKTLDVYADFGSSATGITIPSMAITYRGNTSNLTSTSATVAGVTTAISNATIAAGDATFKAQSFPTAKFLVAGPTGASNVAMGSFNVKATSGIGGAVINKLGFTVPANTIGSVTVGGKTGTVISGMATVTDVAITVPSDASGVDIPVTVSLVCINTSGCAGVSDSSVTVTLNNIEYNNGTTVTNVVPTLAVTPTNKMVGSVPKVTMTSSLGGGLTNTTQQIGSFTVAADAAGDVVLATVPLTTSVAGACALTNVHLRDSQGNTTLTGNVAAGSDVAAAFSSARTLTKGTSETYTVWGTVASCTGAAGTQSVSFQLGAKAGFLWNDVLGGVTGITGALFESYPSVGQTKTN